MSMLSWITKMYMKYSLEVWNVKLKVQLYDQTVNRLLVLIKTLFYVYMYCFFFFEWLYFHSSLQWAALLCEYGNSCIGAEHL